MDQIQVPQTIQQAANSSFYTKETDDLLKKYLKMQIGMFYWGIISRLILYILIAISIITSISMLAPFLEKLTGPLTTYSNLLQGKTDLPTSENSDGQSLDLNAILDALQKQN